MGVLPLKNKIASPAPRGLGARDKSDNNKKDDKDKKPSDPKKVDDKYLRKKE